MFVRIGFKVEPASVPDLKHKLEMDHLPLNVLSLIDRSSDIEMHGGVLPDEEEELYWRVELAKQLTDGSTLVAALRLVWRVHKWTMHYATKIIGVYVYE